MPPIDYTRSGWRAFLKACQNQSEDTIDAFLDEHFEEKGFVLRTDGMVRSIKDWRFSMLYGKSDLIDLYDLVQDGAMVASRYGVVVELFDEDTNESRPSVLETMSLIFHHERTGKITCINRKAPEMVPGEPIWRTPASTWRKEATSPLLQEGNFHQFLVRAYDFESMDTRKWLDMYLVKGAVWRIDCKIYPRSQVSRCRNHLVRYRQHKFLEQYAFCSDASSGTLAAFYYTLVQEQEDGIPVGWVRFENFTFVSLDGETGRMRSLNTRRRPMRPNEPVWRPSDEKTLVSRRDRARAEPSEV